MADLLKTEDRRYLRDGRLDETELEHCSSDAEIDQHGPQSCLWVLFKGKAFPECFGAEETFWFEKEGVYLVVNDLWR